jgi:hypothetical protein
MQHEDLVSKLRGKGINAIEVDRYLADNEITADSIDGKMLDGIAAAIVKGRGGLAVAGAPVAPRSAGRKLVKRQERSAAAVADQEAIAINANALVSATVEADEARLDGAARLGAAQAQQEVQAELLGYLETSTQLQEQAHRVKAGIRGVAPDFSALGVAKAAAEDSVFDLSKFSFLG